MTKLKSIIVFSLFLLGGSSAWSSSVFYNLKNKKTDVKFSPSHESPTKFFLYRKLPVKVIRKYQDWCFIEDSEGEEGWIPENTVSQGSMVLIIADTFLHKEKDVRSNCLARLSKGVLARLKKCHQTLCQIETKNGQKPLVGWVLEKNLWGINSSFY